MGRGLRLKDKGEVEAMLGRNKKKPKYRNKKVEIDGITFDSKREGRRYSELKLLERAGSIKELILQPRFKVNVGGIPICYVETGRQLVYVADFQYFDVESGRVIVEDAKGYATKEYRIKRALMKAMGLNVKEI